MSVRTFLNEYTRNTEPLRVPRIYGTIAKGHRVLNSETELHCEANGDTVALDFISTRIS